MNYNDHFLLTAIKGKHDLGVYVFHNLLQALHLMLLNQTVSSIVSDHERKL